MSEKSDIGEFFYVPLRVSYRDNSFKNNMVTFAIALIALILGYVFYGKFIERLFGADPNREVPATAMADGVDYIAMPTRSQP